VYFFKGDYDRVIADFTEAIRIDPQYDYAYSMRGYVYARKKDYINAIPDYEAALRINPNLTSTKDNLEIARK
jgi:tetratricopeptide (TPR) repeat protein